ncbi:unnamed protein product, partial [Protopolystoma xenopodis]
IHSDGSPLVKPQREEIVENSKISDGGVKNIDGKPFSPSSEGVHKRVFDLCTENATTNDISSSTGPKLSTSDTNSDILFYLENIHGQAPATPDADSKFKLPSHRRSASHSGRFFNLNTREFGEVATMVVEHAEELMMHLWQKGWRLVHHHSLPHWLKDNEYLLRGHRPQLPSFRSCLCFYGSNDTFQ